MKNMKRFLILVVVLSLAFSMSAFAGDPGTIQSIEIDNTRTTTVAYDDGDVQFGSTYNAATENGMYLILVLREQLGSDLPTASDILYVDQATASGTSVTFDVYPTEIEDDESYIYLAGTGLSELTKLGTIIPNVEEITGMKGDVDLDDDVDMADAIMLLRHTLGIETIDDAASLANGEVTGNTTLDMQDCIKILRYYLGIITTFD